MKRRMVTGEISTSNLQTSTVVSGSCLAGLARLFKEPLRVAILEAYNSQKISSLYVPRLLSIPSSLWRVNNLYTSQTV